VRYFRFGIEQCKADFGDIAAFFSGTEHDVPEADTIISSNVFEHLSNDLEIARVLQSKCRQLFITVPYREPLSNIVPCEHVNSYDRSSFSELGAEVCSIFVSKGWSEFGFPLFRDIYLKNLLRPFLGKAIVRRRRQIMFYIPGGVRR